MLQIQVVSWLVVWVILLAFPIGIAAYYFIRFLMKWYSLSKKKYQEVQALSHYRQELLKKVADESRQELSIEEKTSENRLIDIPLENAVQNSSLEVESESKSTQKIQLTDKEYDKHQKLLEKIRYEALLQKDKGNVDNYEKKLIEWLAMDPENFEFMKLLSDFYFSIWNHTKALSLLKKILEQRPDDHKAIWQIWEIYLAKGEFDTAELLIEKAISLKPNDPKYYVSMVEIKYNTQKKEEAANLMEKVIKLRPSHVWYLLALAKLYEEITDYTNAKKYYFKILEFEPMHDLAKQKVQSL